MPFGSGTGSSVTTTSSLPLGAHRYTLVANSRAECRDTRTLLEFMRTRGEELAQRLVVTPTPTPLRPASVSAHVTRL